MRIRRGIALVPNAENPMAEAIRNRTRCKICGARIETGQPIVEEFEITMIGLYHEVCYDSRTT